MEHQWLIRVCMKSMVTAVAPCGDSFDFAWAGSRMGLRFRIPRVPRAC